MDEKKYKVAMSGATGFVGSKLDSSSRELKWQVIPLGRNDFTSGLLAEKMKGADVVLNLAGAPVIKRWTEEYKKTMYESRVDITQRLVSACSQMDPKPKLFMSASAIGYYASGGPHTETSHVKADTFLGHLAEDWEKESMKAKELGIRTVIFRFGVILGKGGGALKEMLTPFKLAWGEQSAMVPSPFPGCI